MKPRLFEPLTLPQASFGTPTKQYCPIRTSAERVTGHLKFYLDDKQYGFLLEDFTGDEIFFHMDDMRKANVSTELLTLGSNKPYVSTMNPQAAGKMRLDLQRQFKLRFEFAILRYVGKYGVSQKAQDIRLIEMIPVTLTDNNVNSVNHPSHQPQITNGTPN